MLIDSKSSKSKKKRKRKDEEEIAKMIEGRRQDENYIYLDIETPEENSEAIMRSNDDMWEPGTSGKKLKPKVKKSSSLSSQPSTSSGKVAIKSEKPQERSSRPPPTGSPSNESAVDKAKKFKKGLATPKQRLAKKLWQRR